MFLIYTDIVTPRLQYVADFVFREQFGQLLKITDQPEEFEAYEGYRIRYTPEFVEGPWFNMPVAGLLSEKGIRQFEVPVSEWEQYPVIFGGERGDIPYDLFSAVFFLLSRYEEYWPHDKDLYGRYPHTSSIAFKYDFLHLPVVNIWLTQLSNALKAHYPGLELPRPAFYFQPTYDIDIAWSYRHKGFLRNLGGFLQKPDFSRWKILAGAGQDPYDSYNWLDRVHDHFELKPIYFFLVASARSRYDKNISPSNPAMRKLIERHARKYAVGIHPSWSSHDNRPLIGDEKRTVSLITEKPVTTSRQHYIWFQTPSTFRDLISAGITDDYSMGYGSINGFRASVASAYHWYDLEREEKTSLRVHPFCFMDANAFYEQKQDVQTSAGELMHYYDTCHQYHGTLISIFHNQFLGTDPVFAGWKEMYEAFISQVQR